FPAWQTILLFIGGMFFWTFFEYLMHRFVFHWVSENPRAQKFIYVMHGNHHLHHYKSEEKGFGVSTHIWDVVFGTAFDLKKEKEDKAEVQKLMYKKSNVTIASRQPLTEKSEATDKY